MTHKGGLWSRWCEGSCVVSGRNIYRDPARQAKQAKAACQNHKRAKRLERHSTNHSQQHSDKDWRQVEDLRSLKQFLHRDPMSAPHWRLANNLPSVNLLSFTQNRAVCHFAQQAGVAHSKETSPLWRFTATAPDSFAKVNARHAQQTATNS